LPNENPRADALVARARREAASAVASGRWSAARAAEWAALFERSAVDALRAPVLAERSIVLRRIGKRLVPTRLLPVARRAVRVADALSRWVVDATVKR
jgi:hypothetical protein